MHAEAVTAFFKTVQFSTDAVPDQCLQISLAVADGDIVIIDRMDQKGRRSGWIDLQLI